MSRRPQPVRALAAVVLRTLLQDRSSLFFMLALPVLIMVVVGTTFGGQQRLQVGVVDGDRTARSAALIDELRDLDGIEVVSVRVDDLARQLGRQRIAVGVVIPRGFATNFDDGRTGVAEVAVVAAATSAGSFAGRTAVADVVEDAGGRLAAARFVAERRGGSTSDLVDRLSPRTTAVSISTTDVGGSTTRGVSRFSNTAAQNLVLFVFMNCLTTGPLLIRMRRGGLMRRVMSTPASTTGIVGGLAAGWMLLALAQSALILVIGGVAFGVSWGDPVGAAALTLSFAAVGCGAGLLVGVLGGNEDRVSAATPVIGLVLAALGGCMMPIEIFPPAMVTVAHAVPHYWALRGWTALMFDHGGLGDVIGPIGALMGFAVVFVGAAALALRRQLTD